MIAQPRKNIMDMFIDGARRGFTIATTSLLPNVVMAFVIIQALKVRACWISWAMFASPSWRSGGFQARRQRSFWPR